MVVPVRPAGDAAQVQLPLLKRILPRTEVCVGSLPNLWLREHSEITTVRARRRFNPGTGLQSVSHTRASCQRWHGTVARDGEARGSDEKMRVQPKAAVGTEVARELPWAAPGAFRIHVTLLPKRQSSAGVNPSAETQVGPDCAE